MDVCLSKQTEKRWAWKLVCPERIKGIIEVNSFPTTEFLGRKKIIWTHQIGFYVQFMMLRHWNRLPRKPPVIVNIQSCIRQGFE